MKCVDYYSVYNLSYFGESTPGADKKHPNPPVEPKRDQFSTDAEYEAALRNYGAAKQAYAARWGSTPPTDPNPPPDRSNYTNLDKYAQDYAAWAAQQATATSQWDTSLTQWDENKSEAAQELIFVERADTLKNEMFDLDPYWPRALNRTFNSSVDVHYDDPDGMMTIDPGSEETDRQRECTSNGGKLLGVGPGCQPGELGALRYHTCYFREMKECMSAYYLCAMAFDTMTRIGGRNALPPVRSNDLSQCKEALKDCIKSAKMRCACEDCAFESCMYGCDNANQASNYPVDPSGSYDPSPVADDANKSKLTKVPGISAISLTGSEYYLTQPIIYGRYIVGGNIIWLGNIQPTTVEVRTMEVKNNTVVDSITQTTVYHASFAVGVSAGPVSGLLRVWLGDTLLYNASVTPGEQDEIDNVLLYSNNKQDNKFYDASKIRLTFFNGDEDQLPPALMGDAPGYRNLAFVLFENVNMSYLGGRIPELRIEVISSASDDAPVVSVVSDSTRFVVDRQSASIYGVSETGAHRYSYDDLSLVSDLSIGLGTDTNSFAVMANGLLAYQDTSTNIFKQVTLFDPDTEQPLTINGIQDNMSVFTQYSNGGVHRAPAAKFVVPYYTMAYAADSLIDTDYVVFMNANGDGVMAKYDPASTTLDIGRVTMVSVGSPIFDARVVRTNFVTYDDIYPNGRGGYRDDFVMLWFDAGAQPALYLRRHSLTRTDTANGLDPEYNITTKQDAQIPAKIWGGAASGLVGAFVIPDPLRDSLIVFVRSTISDQAGFIMSIKLSGRNTFDVSTNWVFPYGNIPSTPCAGESQPVDTYWFINSLGVPTAVDLLTGDITEVPEYGSFPATTQQHYDGLRGSITYLNASGINRVYVGRVASNSRRLSDILVNLAERAGVAATADIELDDIFVDGYIIDDNTKPNDAIYQLMTLYGVATLERATSLHFTLLSDETVDVAYDSAHYEAYEYTQVDPFSQPGSFKLTYPDIDNKCKPTSKTVNIAIARQPLNDVSSETYTAPVVFSNPNDAMNLTERMFARKLIELNEAVGVLGPRALVLEPGDRISMETDGVVIANRVRTISLTPQRLSAAVDLYADAPYLADITPVSAQEVVAVPTSRNYVNVRTRAYFFPAMTPTDQLKAGTDSAVVYVGVTKNSVRAMKPINIDYRLLGVDQYFHAGATVTKEITRGTLISMPASDVSPGIPDIDSTMIVKFDKPVVLDSSDGRPEDTAADNFLRLIVVGKEVMQYTKAVDSGDGRTYTLTGLIRGKYGSEVWINFHAEGEEVVLFDSDALKPIYIPMEAAVKTSLIALRQNAWVPLNEIKRTSLTPWDNVSILPPAPVQLNRYDAENGDILLTWNHRGVYDSDFKDATDDVPLSPAQKVYNAYTKTLPQFSYYPYGNTFIVLLSKYERAAFPTDFAAITKGITKPTQYTTQYMAQAVVTEDKSYIKKSVLDAFGLSNQDLYVAVVKLGGPSMQLPGYPAMGVFPKNKVYPSTPVFSTVVNKKAAGYAVLSQGMTTLHKMNRFLVLKPVP